jgi:hypothetical protein
MEVPECAGMERSEEGIHDEEEGEGMSAHGCPHCGDDEHDLIHFDWGTRCVKCVQGAQE